MLQLSLVPSLLACTSVRSGFRAILCLFSGNGFSDVLAAYGSFAMRFWWFFVTCCAELDFLRVSQASTWHTARDESCPLVLACTSGRTGLRVIPSLSLQRRWFLRCLGTHGLVWWYWWSSFTCDDKFQQVLEKPVVVQRLLGWSRQCIILAFSCSSWTRLFVARLCNDRDHGPDCAESLEFVQFLDKIFDVPVVVQRLVPWSRQCRTPSGSAAVAVFFQGRRPPPLWCRG